MAEYNMKYLSLKKRLETMKLLVINDSNPDKVNLNIIHLEHIDRLLKDLDARYEELLFLGVIECEINKLSEEL